MINRCIMKPIFFTIDKALHLKVIPDTQYHLDGHEILTYNYNVYLDNTKHDPAARSIDETSSDKMTDTDYFGAIAFEKPGQIFSYTPGEYRQLTRKEVEEVIEYLNRHRDNPSNWQLDN